MDPSENYQSFYGFPYDFSGTPVPHPYYNSCAHGTQSNGSYYQPAQPFQNVTNYYQGEYPSKNAVSPATQTQVMYTLPPVAYGSYNTGVVTPYHSPEFSCMENRLVMPGSAGQSSSGSNSDGLCSYSEENSPPCEKRMVSKFAGHDVLPAQPMGSYEHGATDPYYTAARPAAEHNTGSGGERHLTPLLADTTSPWSGSGRISPRDSVTPVEPLQEVSPSQKPRQQRERKPTRPSGIHKEAVATLERWYRENLSDPYPDRGQVTALAERADVTPRQVRKWFSNKRCRDGNTRHFNDIVRLRRERRRQSRRQQPV